MTAFKQKLALTSYLLHLKNDTINVHHIRYDRSGDKRTQRDQQTKGMPVSITKWIQPNDWILFLANEVA